jgi:hypothetical protein
MLPTVSEIILGHVAAEIKIHHHHHWLDSPMWALALLRSFCQLVLSSHIRNNFAYLTHPKFGSF